MSKGTVRETVRGFIPPGALEGAQLQRIVLQGLDRVVSAEQRDVVVNLALDSLETAALPTTAAELTAFVFGPLRDAVERTCGPQAAERALLSLTPFLKQACRHEAASPESAADATASQPPDPRSSSAPSQPPDVASVLLVEHDAKARAQLAQQLRARGFEVFTAPDGHVALAVSMRSRPDVIVAAMDMPVVGGRQLMALLRVAFATEAPPVLLLADADGEPPARIDDAVGLLTRPLDLDALVAQLEAVVTERESQRAPRT